MKHDIVLCQRSAEKMWMLGILYWFTEETSNIYRNFLALNKITALSDDEIPNFWKGNTTVWVNQHLRNTKPKPRFPLSSYQGFSPKKKKKKLPNVKLPSRKPAAIRNSRKDKGKSIPWGRGKDGFPGAPKKTEMCCKMCAYYANI